MNNRVRAETIAAHLFTNIAGQVAERLVLELPDGREGGGWGLEPAIRQIEKILDATETTKKG